MTSEILLKGYRIEDNKNKLNFNMLRKAYKKMLGLLFMECDELSLIDVEFHDKFSIILHLEVDFLEDTETHLRERRWDYKCYNDKLNDIVDRSGLCKNKNSQSYYDPEKNEFEFEVVDCLKGEIV